MKNRSNTQFMVRLALLIAVELVMAYTPLGYFKTAGLEITFMMVPVTLGAILLGPLGGAVLGGVFGLTSFATCFGASAFGAALLAVNPLATFVVCFVPRVLAGLLPGLLFAALSRRGRPRSWAFGLCALLAPLLNTLFFMTTLCLFFYNSDFIQSIAAKLGAGNVFVFVGLFVGVQGLVEAAVCFVLSGILARVLYGALNRAA